MPDAIRDQLDDKVNQVFAGKCVRKDLVRAVKVGANVPVFVLEYLLGKYCASSDPGAIELGLTVVRDTLANNYIRPDEATKAQSMVKQKGRYTFIDKVKVRLTAPPMWPSASTSAAAICASLMRTSMPSNAYLQAASGRKWVEWDESDEKHHSPSAN